MEHSWVMFANAASGISYMVGMCGKAWSINILY